MIPCGKVLNVDEPAQGIILVGDLLALGIVDRGPITHGVVFVNRLFAHGPGDPHQPVVPVVVEIGDPLVRVFNRHQVPPPVVRALHYALQRVRDPDEPVEGVVFVLRGLALLVRL